MAVLARRPPSDDFGRSCRAHDRAVDDPGHLCGHAVDVELSDGHCTDDRNMAASQPNRGPRSEEHTSELQSLMRISYAVFCLKKKNKKKSLKHNITHITK